MEAQKLIDIICPEHTRASCSDTYLANEGRCSRCTLMLIAQGIFIPKSTYFIVEFEDGN